MADHVLPATHAGTATQARAVAFHAKAGVLQAQLACPVSALLVLYSCEVPHCVQVESPASEKKPAMHAEPQTALLVALHAAVVEEPAHEVQAEQGARPVAALKLTPATHESRVHVTFVAFHAKLVAHPQLLWPVRLVGA